jgi:hypothetical protein
MRHFPGRRFQTPKWQKSEMTTRPSGDEERQRRHRGQRIRVQGKEEKWELLARLATSALYPRPASTFCCIVGYSAYLGLQ